MMAQKIEFSKYERARILGARGLQIAMDAPILVKMDEDTLSNLNFDPLKIAEIELDSGVLPISVNRPMPQRKEEELGNVKIEDHGASDEEKIKAEQEEEKDIAESGEMMELATPEDERDDNSDLGSDEGSEDLE